MKPGPYAGPVRFLPCPACWGFLAFRVPPPAMGRVLAAAALNKETWGGSTNSGIGFFLLSLVPVS